MEEQILQLCYPDMEERILQLCYPDMVEQFYRDMAKDRQIQECFLTTMKFKLMEETKCCFVDNSLEA
uniref:Uncharacterized protein n=1 Tax=Acrobeloides nanus TaxID=290746 RepID=A0A914BY31_9BILA